MFHFHLTLLNDMKKIIITIISFCYSVSSFCQAWAMDEAADDARESEPITIGSIISFLVFAGIIYFIYAIISSYNESREKKRKEKFDKDFHERIVREKAGRYKCPICGKEYEGDDYSSMLVYNKEECFRAKYCKSCANRHYEYSVKYHKWQRNHRSEVPDWYGGLTLGAMVLSDVAWIIYHIVIGKFDYLIGRLFFTPILAMCVMGIFALIYIHLLQPSEPYKPFDDPSKKHVEECNALIK